MELLTDGLIENPEWGDIIVTTGVACGTRGYTKTPTTPFGGIFAFFAKIVTKVHFPSYPIFPYICKKHHHEPQR
jgi:hypothetical protein